MLDDFSVRFLKKSESSVLYQWCCDLSWNPVLSDINSMIDNAQGGIFVGERNQQPISAISAVIYHSHFAFIGYYITHKACNRGKGFGLRTWHHAFDYLEQRGVQYVGLEAGALLVPVYKKMGFEPAHVSQRYCYKVKQSDAPASVVIGKPDKTLLEAFDAQFVYEKRPEVVAAWLSDVSQRQHAYIMQKDRLVGYGALRRAHKHYRLGPLYAESGEMAESLVLALAHNLPQGANIFLDIPEANDQCREFINRLQFQSCDFISTRMYKGLISHLPMNHVFALGSLEMG